MVSFSSLRGKQMHSNAEMLTGVLRGEQGFDGLVVSDWGGHSHLKEGANQKEKLALMVNAGVDLVMVPEKYKEYLADMEAAVAEGLISEDRIRAAAGAVLRFKKELGLFESPWAPRSLLSCVRCPEHLNLARKAVQRSLVLLRNRGGVLPLPRTTRAVHVSGKVADDLGLMCGGWTASWQGARGRITDGTTILEALREALPDTIITHEPDGEGLDPVVHQAAICCVGEEPYSEWFGDRYVSQSWFRI